MTLKNLTIEEFDNFSKLHNLSNYYQTTSYGILKAESKYEYDLIGLVDEYDNIYAASLILFKPIGIGCCYGYAPRGFLIDYNNEILVNEFTQKLKDYYYEKNCIFIKINPNITIGKVNDKYITEYNDNLNIRNVLDRCGYTKLKDNLYFESQLPRFNAYVDLKNSNFKGYSKNTRNKIRKSTRKGLRLQKYSKEYINEFFDLIKNSITNDEFYYKDYYTAFEKNDNIDLFLVTVDYQEFLINSQEQYDIESERNYKLNEKIAEKYDDKVINAKMSSDKSLLTYKNDIVEATKGMIDNERVVLAGALVIKHNNMASIVLSGHNKSYKRFAPNYFLYHNLIEYYKDSFDYLDINGVVGDFTNDNYYHGLNRFKMGFKPEIHEFIGEYDLIIEPKSYKILLDNGILSKALNKNNKKKSFTGK